jgi:hypothetical protein
MHRQVNPHLDLVLEEHEPGTPAEGELAKTLQAMLGNLPSDLIGVLGGDHLHQYRLQNREHLRKRTMQILQDRGVELEKSTPNAAVTLPLIEAAQDESSPELTDLWARLLATAIDNSTALSARKMYVQILKQLDPIDARVLQLIFRSHPAKASWAANHMTVTADEGLRATSAAEKLGTSYEAVCTAYDHLERLGCISIYAEEESGKIALSKYVNDGLRSALFPAEYPIQDLSKRYDR